MMKECLKIMYQGGTGEIVEKKSRFIASCYPLKSEEEAAALIEAAKKKYWDARHNCYAYVLGKNSEVQRYSDDGEPQGTAGKPMLEVLTGQEIHDCLVIVTRYFGGILLGTGGLVRAYQQAVKEGLDRSVIIEWRKGRRINVICDYSDVGRIQHLAENEGVCTERTAYGADVEFSFLAASKESEDFVVKLTEATAGQALIEPGDELWFGIADGRAVLEQA